MSDETANGEEKATAEDLARATSRFLAVLGDLGYRREAVIAVRRTVDLFSSGLHSSEGGLGKLLQLVADLQRVPLAQPGSAAHAIDQSTLLEVLNALQVLRRIIESAAPLSPEVVNGLIQRFAWAVTINQTKTLGEKVSACYKRKYPPLLDAVCNGHGRDRGRTVVVFRARVFGDETTIAQARAELKIAGSSSDLDVLEALMDFPGQYPSIAELFGLVGVGSCIATDRKGDCVPMLSSRPDAIELSAYHVDARPGRRALYLQAVP